MYRIIASIEHPRTNLIQITKVDAMPTSDELEDAKLLCVDAAAQWLLNDDDNFDVAKQVLKELIEVARVRFEEVGK